MSAAVLQEAKGIKGDGHVRMLTPCQLVETEYCPGFVERLPDQVPAVGGDVVVHLPEDHGHLGVAQVAARDALEGIVALAGAEAVAVYVRREVAHSTGDPGVHGAAEGEVAAETHPRCPD